MRILIIVPNQDHISGNWVTAQRFQQGLETNGHQVVLHGTQLQAEGRLKQQLLVFAPDACILLHAYRSGKPWLDEARNLDIPYLVVLTGTDVNHGLDDQEQSAVIRILLQQAAGVILQNPLIFTDLVASHPELTANLHPLAPGISLGKSPYDIRDLHNLPQEQTLFLCPAGLRPVKGVLSLLEMFDLVVDVNPAFSLVFCGPILNEDYGKKFLAALEVRPWASYLGAIPTQAMASAMRGADVILNNSQTEGLANALLEAATLGIPILASNIPGNAAVVRHNINGLRYDNETQFVQYASQLFNRDRCRQLSCPDPNRYNPTRETAELVILLQKALKD